MNFFSSTTDYEGADWPKRTPLRGIERFGVSVDGVSIKCMLQLLVSGDVDTLLRFLPTALMRAFNRHPRMRMLIVRDELFVGEIQPHLSLDDIATKNLLVVRELSSDDDQWVTWGEFVESECQVGFDRYEEFMFKLHAWVDKKTGLARLMMFSDHIVCDGDSVMAVMNQILEDVALLSKEQAQEVEEFPLRPSLYEMWFPHPWWLKPLAKTMLALFGRKGFIDATKTFTPVMKPRADQHDFCLPFTLNSTSALFQEGTAENMKSTLKKCKEEKVTFTGALVAVIVAAFYHANKVQGKPDPEGNFKLSAELNYNMRQRVAQPAEETQVGLYVTIAGCPFLGTEGVDMKSTKFWDLARRAREEVVQHANNQLVMAMPLFMMDRKLHKQAAGSFLGDYKVKNSVTGDVNISSIGRYLYPKEHVLAHGTLQVKTMHTFAAVPFIGANVTLWCSSVDAFQYSIGHKSDDAIGKELFRAYVKVCENAGQIEADDTMLDVLKKLDL